MTLPMETERLTLRLFTDDDAEEYLKIVLQPEIMEGHNVEEVPDVATIREGILKRTESWQKRGFTRAAVIVRETGQLIGSVGLAVIPDNEEVVEVVWTISKEFTRQGYATEAARAWLVFGLEELGLASVIALANAGNHASIRVMEKLGLRSEGMTEEYYDRELVIYRADRDWLDGNIH